MNNFRKLVVGHYSNREQAFSNPSVWPMMDLKVWITGENTFESKSWYNYKGEENAYNWLRYTIVENSLTTVKTSIYNVLKDTETCPFTWNLENGWWHGQTDGECIIGDIRFTSNVRFDGYNYKTIDTGIDINTNKLKWGKYPEEGEFAFVEI